MKSAVRSVGRKSKAVHPLKIVVCDRAVALIVLWVILGKATQAVIFVAIGSNLQAEDMTSLEMCVAAAVLLRNIEGLTLTALSSWYESAPIPLSEQPSYINGVACLQGDIEPLTLLKTLQGIETQFGRVRSVPNAARTLDLDVVAMGDLVRLRPDPILPHPRMHERAFVLCPLLEIAPEWRHPVLHVTAAEMLGKLPQQAIRKLPPSHLRDGGRTTI